MNNDAMQPLLDDRAKASGDEIPVDDYRQLAWSFDWQRLIGSIASRRFSQTDASHLKVLDVACGTGRWLETFQRYIQPKMQNGQNIRFAYDLLDCCPRSLAQAAAKVRAPHVLGRRFADPVQHAALSERSYDLFWCMHGFYAMPRVDCSRILEKMVRSLHDDGIGLIAQSSRGSFYIDFYDHFLNCFEDGNGERFTSAEHVIECLRALGIHYQVQILRYEERVPMADVAAVERYIFDEATVNSFKKEDATTIKASCSARSLADLRRHPAMAKYLDSLIRGDSYYFPEEVWLIQLRRRSTRPFVISQPLQIS